MALELLVLTSKTKKIKIINYFTKKYTGTRFIFQKLAQNYSNVGT